VALGGHPYREAPAATGGGSTALAHIDVSGADGAHGARGADGSDGRASGSSGSDGGHAGAATPGQDAGWIRVRLSGDEAGMVTVQGRMAAPGASETAFERTAYVGEAGAVELRAVGGCGGDGGVGGDGGRGADGRDGSDATRYSSGSNGGDGGAGGDGGDGSSGAAGGCGGAITVEVGADDTHLLMLVEHAVDGGDGGAAGRNGQGGRGGKGGDGGSSYSWTETDTSTDSNGNTQTNTTSHYNSGGSDGSDGRSGHDGRAVIRGGARGDGGALTIEVAGEGGATQRYAARFELQLASFALAEVRPDGVFEPGELVRVRDLRVVNVGGMPMPRRASVKLGLEPAGWMTPEGDELICPPSLAAGTPVTIDGELGFRIRDREAEVPGEPLADPVTLGHRAWIPEIRRGFAGYHGADTQALGRFVIQWPVKLAAPAYLASLAPGETTRVRLSIASIATRALGGAAPDGRRLQVRVRAAPDSELGDEHVMLRAAGVTLQPSSGWLHELQRLEPEASATLELEVAIAATAPPYRAFTAHVSVELGRLDAPGEPRAVQLRALQIRVARPFRAEDADVLLIVNHRTTHQVLQAWEEMARRLMARVAVWDLSREGHLDLDRRLAHGATLAETFAGKAVVVLDNTFDGPDGPIRASDCLDAAQLRGAAMSGLDVAIVGGAMDLRARLIPPPAQPEQANVQVVDEDAIEHALQHGPRSVTVVERTYWLPWRRPSPRWLERRAAALSARLARALPHRRHLVVHRFAPVQLRDGLLRRHWRIGTLETMRTLDTATGAVVHAEASDAELADPAYAGSHRAAIAVLTMLDFEEQLERLRWVLSHEPVEPSAVEQITGTLLADLVNELVVAMAGGPSRDLALAQAMPRLTALAERLGPTPLDGPAGAPLLTGLAAPLLVAADAHVSWLSRLPPWRWWSRTVRVRDHVHHTLDLLLDTLFGAAADRARTQLATAIADLRKTTIRRDGWFGGRRRAALAHGRAILALPGVTSDTEVLALPAERVLSSDEADALAATERTAAARRTTLVTAAEQARRDLLVVG
jgi:hypothetical protein